MAPVDIEILLRQRMNLYKTKSDLKKSMDSVQIAIEDINSLVYRSCNHNWVVQPRVEHGGPTEYMCSTCNLYKS